ncbi:glycoside hydrolase superfamily [Protomyces lactucae-debilis]|uniref:chitinase n=1 Tax=Protomyces lactucae-debilis TaxID=2754530 RepID=A0A1Y2EXB6_PROLT|nr:glycoside hydrolase superfamily [Protomyces lactucae-debilis]ORY75766.1 glycoside hydrolase superfamily [Protomyces lactucae-debilis]
MTGSRVVVYHQTHHVGGMPISALPLVTHQAGVTHLIIGAVHLNETSAGGLSLNDDPPESTRYTQLWSEVPALQASGIKVMAMLGGAAQGSFQRLDAHARLSFEEYYHPLRNFLRQRNFDGIDLDVEEKMSLGGIIRLIDRLVDDFGRDFIITLAPVATALLLKGNNLSGFNYFDLEVARGRYIDFYNTQFYCGHGSLKNISSYQRILDNGWDPRRVVVGVSTNPSNCKGWVPLRTFSSVLREMQALALLRDNQPLFPGESDRGPAFGGISGWEYFNSLPGSIERPWEWASIISRLLGNMATPEPVELLAETSAARLQSIQITGGYS